MKHLLLLLGPLLLLLTGCPSDKDDGSATDSGSGTTDADTDTDAGTTDTDADTDADTDTDGGSGLEPGQCRDDGDCDGEKGEYCWTTDDDWCGVCEDPTYECGPLAPKGTPDCDDGRVCTPRHLDCPCSGSEETSWECRPACEPGSCAEGWTCDETEGTCVIIHCTEDASVCSPLHHCEGEPSTAPGSTDSGCVRDACEEDAGCGEGNYCVEARCHSEPGFCDDGPE